MTRKDYDLIAACLGATYKRASIEKNPEDRMGAVWDCKNRIVNELRLENPRFNSDIFISRIQYWYEKHIGF